MVRLCRLSLLLLLVLVGFAAFNSAGTTLESNSSVLAADNFQPMNVKTGLWKVTASNNLAGNEHSYSYNTCVTEKDLHTNPFGKGPDEKCDWTVLKSNSTDMEVRGNSCDAGKEFGMKTDVNLKIHAVDTENVKAEMQGTSSGNGQNMSFSGTFTGKWVRANCPPGTN